MGSTRVVNSAVNAAAKIVGKVQETVKPQTGAGQQQTMPKTAQSVGSVKVETAKVEQIASMSTSSIFSDSLGNLMQPDRLFECSLILIGSLILAHSFALYKFRSGKPKSDEEGFPLAKFSLVVCLLVLGGEFSEGLKRITQLSSSQVLEFIKKYKVVEFYVGNKLTLQIAVILSLLGGMLWLGHILEKNKKRAIENAETEEDAESNEEDAESDEEDAESDEEEEEENQESDESDDVDDDDI